MEKVLSEIKNIRHLDSGNFFLIAGPCVIEGEEITMEVARHLKKITNDLRLPFIFKSSYRKANRSKIDSFKGIGDEKALKILKHIKEELSVPVLTDIHTEEEAALAANYVDVLQIPAFLCRQTELLIAAAKTGKVVNIKKGQFLSAEAMRHVAQKMIDSGNSRIMLTERGTMFGYHDLIVDYRGIIDMKKFGFPVVLDITHSLQQPNQSSGVSGGRPEMIETIARAGIAVGVDGLFLETHPNPAKALSDGANMLALDLFEDMMKRLVKIRRTILEL